MVSINSEDVDIPIHEEKFSLKGSIYKSTEKKNTKGFLINFPGLLEHRNSKFVKFFSESFALEGFHVLTYDYRAHGETSKQTGKNWLKYLPKIFTDLNIAIKWVIDNFNLAEYNNRIVLFGRSLGGAIILTQGFNNIKTHKLIALCTRYDYHSYTKVPFPENIIQKVSPCYFLEKRENNKDRILIAHCKDDQQIPFENIGLIKNHLDLPNSNVITYETGGHSFKNHREDVLQKVLKFLEY